MERFFDVIFSTTALFLMSPLLILIIIILKFTGEKEVLFFQERIGKSGKSFKLFKFATMLKNSPNISTGTITMKDDSRILPVGRVLRKSKLNELPQLINILLGDMSLIGPRPLTKQTFSAYTLATQNVITLVRPGLSGLGSIIFRNEEEIMHGEAARVVFYNTVIAPYKGELEEWFVYNKNTKLYFTMIFMTIWVVLFPQSQAHWRILKKLPEPPKKLKSIIKYKS